MMPEVDIAPYKRLITRGLVALRRRLVFIALTFGLSLLAMLISFGIVRWLTLGMDQERVPDPMVQRRAILLRGFANDLTASCNDYARVVAERDGGVSPDARTWIDRVCRRNLRFLEQRMADNPMPRLPAFLQLQAAVHRCASMARHPEDLTLRRSALRDAKAAIDGAHAHITSIGMDRLAGPHPRRLQF